MTLRDRLLGGASFSRVLRAADDGGAAGGSDDNNNQGDGGQPQGGAAGGDGGQQGQQGQGDGGQQQDQSGSQQPDDQQGQGDGGQQTPQQRGDWRDRQINRQHAQLQEERRRRIEIETELDTARQLLARSQGGGQQPDQQGGTGGTPAAGGGSATPAAPSQDLIQLEAAKIVAKQNFDSASNQAWSNGVKEYGNKFQEAIDRVTTLGGFDHDTMQNIVMATDKPEQVLYTLGQNPDEYHRIMDLPPAKRLAELVKLGLPKAAPKPKRPSGAPPPAEHVEGRNQPDPTELRDDLPDEEWFKRRDAQKNQKFAAAQGRK